MIKKVGIVGFGQMGSGIGQVTAAAGYQVVAVEVTDDAYRVGMKYIEKSLGKMLEKGKIDEAKKNSIIDNITGTTDLHALADCDIICEAVVENMNVKKEIFTQLDEICPPSS